MFFDDDGRVRDWLTDIVENAARIANYVKDLSLEQFKSDWTPRDASERCLERVIEACVRLGPERLALLVPDQSLKKIRGLGNILRHAYDRIDDQVIWDTLTQDIPALRAACERMLAAP